MNLKKRSRQGVAIILMEIFATLAVVGIVIIIFGLPVSTVQNWQTQNCATGCGYDYNILAFLDDIWAWIAGFVFFGCIVFGLIRSEREHD